MDPRAGRALVSYDDITTPQLSPPTSDHPPRPPAKTSKKQRKRKNNKDNGGGQSGAGPSRHQQSTHRQHPYAKSAVVKPEPEPEPEEEWHGEESMVINLGDETWDDSELVDAWDVATQEYEARHGPGKNWKNQPIEKLMQAPEEFPEEIAIPEAPAFSVPDAAAYVLPSAGFVGPTGSVTRDEAATRALGAMYWVGYWTAIYHAADSIPAAPTKPDEEELVGLLEDEHEPVVALVSEDDHDSDPSSVYHEEDLVSTQR